MIKRTLYFGNPAYLSMNQKQLIIQVPEVACNESLPDSFKTDAKRSVPIEDIGVMILDNRQITLTQGLLEALIENNCALITCDATRMPVGLMLPLCGNTTQNERFRAQLEASLPLQKQLWQQTVQMKIANQAANLKVCKGAEVRNMLVWVDSVKSGDTDNVEARAAAYYWPSLFERFKRDREGFPPNNLLNYGYAVLRAVVARALVGSGLLPTLGIHHCNRYNAYCLADDIMEPYRPYVDKLVFDLWKAGIKEVDKCAKMQLLSIPVVDVVIDGQRSPLMIAVGQTTASLYKCYAGEVRKIIYPEM